MNKQRLEYLSKNGGDNRRRDGMSNINESQMEYNSRQQQQQPFDSRNLGEPSQLSMQQRSAMDDMNQFRESQLEDGYHQQQQQDMDGDLNALKEQLENKNEEECREDILQYLECHDPNKYRKKIKGFHIAFNIREKVLRIGDGELSKYKFKSNLPPDEIKRLANEAKAKRAQEKAQKEKDEKDRYQKERETLRKMHEQMRREKGLQTGRKEVGKGSGYQEIGAKSGDEKHLKITFAVIEKMHYSDFNSGNDAEDFKPSDIIDEEDTGLSDDEVLRKFKNDNKIAPDFDGKVLLNARSNNNLLIDSSAGVGLGLKPKNAISPRDVNPTAKRQSVGGAPPYLIDPLQEKIHTLKNQLQQQIGSGKNTERSIGLQKGGYNSKLQPLQNMGDPVLSQKNLANYNQQLNALSKRDGNGDPSNGDRIGPLQDLRSGKKRGQAGSTDLVGTNRALRANPLTDVRKNENKQQYELSPQRNNYQAGPSGQMPGLGADRKQKSNVAQSLDSQAYRQQNANQIQQRLIIPPGMGQVQSLGGLNKDSISIPIQANYRPQQQQQPYGQPMPQQQRMMPQQQQQQLMMMNPQAKNIYVLLIDLQYTLVETR